MWGWALFSGAIPLTSYLYEQVDQLNINDDDQAGVDPEPNINDDNEADIANAVADFTERVALVILKLSTLSSAWRSLKRSTNGVQYFNFQLPNLPFVVS